MSQEISSIYNDSIGKIQRMVSEFNVLGLKTMEKYKRENKYLRQVGVSDSWYEFEKKLSDARDVFMEEFDKLCKEYGYESYDRPTLVVSHDYPYYLAISHDQSSACNAKQNGYLAYL